jgi:hypothetical protein
LASPLLKVKVGTSTGKSTPTPSGKKPLVKGSFDAPAEGASEWAGFGHPDEFYKTVQGDCKQCYDFSVGAGSQPGHTGSTTAIEVAWSYPFFLLPLIFGAILKIRRNDPLNRLKNVSSTRRVNAPVARTSAGCET